MGEDLWALACSVGREPVAAELLTPLPSAEKAIVPATRAAFRVRYADGLQLKARRHRDQSTAERVLALRGALDPIHLPPLVAAEGLCQLTEWVEGTTPDPDDPSMLALAGSLLGAIHRTELAPCLLRYHFPYQRWVDRNRRNAEEVAGAGALTRTEADLLQARLSEGAPADAKRAVVHADLAPENLVVTADRTMMLVDNENLSVDAPGFDLARTWYRWPMTQHRAALFLQGYRSVSDPSPFLDFERFWTMVVLLEAAHFRVLLETPRASVPLEILRRMLAGGEGWPGSEGEEA